MRSLIIALMVLMGTFGTDAMGEQTLSVHLEAPGAPELENAALPVVAVGDVLVAVAEEVEATENTLLQMARPQDDAWREWGRAPGRVVAMLPDAERNRVWVLAAEQPEATQLYALDLPATSTTTSDSTVPTALLELPFPMHSASMAWHQGNIYVAALTGGREVPSLHFGQIAIAEDERMTWTELSVEEAPSTNLHGMARISSDLYLLTEDTATRTAHLQRWNKESGFQDLPLPENIGAMKDLLPYGDNHALILTDSPIWWQYHPITESWVAVEAVVEPERLAGATDYAGGFLLWLQEGELLESLHMSPITRRGGLNWLDYSAIFLYFAVLVGIGAFFSRREGDTNAFFLGNRRVPWWAVGLSIFGTALSPITYLSIPARAFAADWVFLLAYAGIVLMGPIVVFFYLPHFRRVPISTAYEYLERRFNWPTRVYGSICFMLYQGLRVSFMLFLPAITLSAVTGLDIYLCIGAMGVLATLYTVMGGIEAVIWTDVLQTLVLTTGLVLAIGIVVLRVDGGPLALVATAHEADKFHMINWGWGATTATVWVVLLGNLFSSFYPQTADQTIVQRYLTTSTEKEAARAVWTNALLHIPLPILFFGLGAALWVYFKSHPENLDPTLQNDAVLPLFIIAEFPLGLRGVIIAGIFAAAMSSLDSSVNSVASVLVNDYYRRWRRHITEHQALRMSRIISLAFGCFGTIAAMFVARLNALSLWDPFLEFLGLVGSGLAGVVALGVFTTRSNGAGALTGAATSALVLLWVRETSLHFFLYAVIGFMTAFVVGWSASFILPGKPKSLTDVG